MGNSYGPVVDIQKKVFALRKRAGLTSTEMAKRIGLSQSFVSQLENTSREVGLKAVIGYCNHFNITIENFLFGSVDDVEKEYLENEIKRLKNAHSAK